MLPLVVIVESKNGLVRRYAFADSPVSVGRSPFADLQLSESFVSRWEGNLRFDDDELTYFSLGSTNPTLLDGRQIAPGEDTLLAPGAVVTLGDLTLRFSREPVPENDLRRRGKPKPVQEGQDTSLKTAYLDGAPRRTSASDSSVSRVSSESGPSGTPSYAQSAPLSAAPPPRPSYPSSPPAQSPQARSDVRLLGRVTVVGVGAPSEAAISAGSPSQPPQGTEPRSSGQLASPSDHAARPSREWSRSSEVSPTWTQPGKERTVDDYHAAYRSAWERMLAAITAELAQLPDDRRATYASDIQRQYPQACREPAFRTLLGRYGLRVQKSEVPEIGEWLSAIARDVLPARMSLDTGLTLERILGLLETLTQSLGEINDAQNTVRERWLGRQPKQSVLGSENGRAILAYLLNPHADWSARLLELEQTIRQAATHELALFQATIEGARLLVQAVSPQAIANELGIDLAQLESSERAGLWGRFRAKDAPEALLWQGFVKTYEALMDSDRYQRVFLGRAFAKTYLAAMGQGKRER